MQTQLADEDMFVYNITGGVKVSIPEDSKFSFFALDSYHVSDYIHCNYQTKRTHTKPHLVCCSKLVIFISDFSIES